MLVDVQYIVLGEEENEWLTFTNELSRTVKMLLRKAGLLIKATVCRATALTRTHLIMLRS